MEVSEQTKSLLKQAIIICDIYSHSNGDNFRNYLAELKPESAQAVQDNLAALYSSLDGINAQLNAAGVPIKFAAEDEKKDVCVPPPGTNYTSEEWKRIKENEDSALSDEIASKYWKQAGYNSPEEAAEAQWKLNNEK